MDRETLPPTQADEAALAFSASQQARSRSAEFFAAIQHTARMAGLKETHHDVDSDVHGESL